MSCFIDSSCFLEFCIAVFSFEAVTSSKYCQIPSGQIHFLLVLLITGTFSVPIRNTCAPCFLPPCGRNLKLLCLLSSLKLTTLAAENLHGLGLPKLALTAIHGSIHKDLAEDLSVGLTFGALRMPAGQVGDPCARFSQRFVVGFFLES